ncbi:Sec-independent protein translocase subunit TatA [Streptomyces sp. NPDC097640]|uniref:Sec-independent protein translocase subunit TatA n=1 Tax=Streptomyces sp. NPDC097640 TaxID=3157229 RepID=UPI00331F12B3
MLRNGLEPWHLLIVAIVVIMVFGSKKLPDTARALGKSVRILKSEAKAMKEDGAARSATPSGDGSGSQTSRGVQVTPGDAATARQVPEDGAAR